MSEPASKPINKPINSGTDRKGPPRSPNKKSDSSAGSSTDSPTDSSVETLDRIDVPKLYKVILLNDDFTPMDFVILILKRFFSKDDDSAAKIMLDVHQKGSGIAGVYTLETAEMKVMQVNQFARMNQHPLKSTLEEAP
jgi:ATP-dependent Clp protease adaptor protein ClpS